MSEFEKAKEILSRLDIPWVTTIGNHDLLTNGRSIYRDMFGNPTYSFVFKQTKFILFNNNNWEDYGAIPDYDWVENELSTSSSTYNILLSHVAPNDRERFSDSQILDWENLVDTYSVDYYLNGHNHNSGTNTFGGATTHVTIGSPAKEKYLELRINNSEATHAFIDI